MTRIGRLWDAILTDDGFGALMCQKCAQSQIRLGEWAGGGGGEYHWGGGGGGRRTENRDHIYICVYIYISTHTATQSFTSLFDCLILKFAVYGCVYLFAFRLWLPLVFTAYSYICIKTYLETYIYIRTETRRKRERENGER